MRRPSPPGPNLRLACGLLFLSIVLLMVARVVPLPRLTPLFGVPFPVVARIALFTVSLLFVFSSYAYAIYSVRELAEEKMWRAVLGFTAVLCVPAVVNQDLFSNDVYGYIFYGRMVHQYSVNPYVTLPANSPSDAALSYMDWRNLLSPYGPLWTSWSAAVDRVVTGSMRLHVLAFKVLAALVHLVNTVLVGVVVRKISPRNTIFAMAAYGWSPLAVMEFALNAHNDAYMLMFVLSSLLALYHGRPLVGAVLLGMAISIKFTAVLFLPFYLLAVLWGPESLRVQLRRVTLMVLLIALVYVGSWSPFMSDGGWRRMLILPEQSEWYLNSLPASMYTGVRNLLVWLLELAPVRAGDLADIVVTTVSLALMLYVAYRLARLVRRRHDLIEIWFWFVFAYLFFVGPYFWPWYATSLVVLSAMSRDRHVWLVTTTLCLTAMFTYSCSDCRTYVNTTDSPLTGLAIFLLPLLTLVILFVRDRSRATILERVPIHG